MTTYKNITITDDDINWVETLLKGITFDLCRRDIIKSMDSVDIQAFPGTGKTTLLVAKLAILAKKWESTSSGICVLSHTNVAREEIELRLGNSDIGKTLLSYPHFIGTVHSFFATYITLPWICSKEIDLMIIDTEIVTKKRWKNLPHNTRTYLEKKRYDHSICEAKELPIKLSIKCGENTQSYKNLQQKISDSLTNGEFTYDEVLLIAQNALHHNRGFSKSIPCRFPFLFIDEAQDTSESQWNLILSAFGDDLIRQGIGDSNQAIYTSIRSSVSNCVHFPRMNHLEIYDSRRFGVEIAKSADNLAVNSRGMVGVSEKFQKIENPKILFVFDKPQISQVIDDFGLHLLQILWDDDLKSYSNGIHVIGMVCTSKAVDTSSKKFPSCLSDYFSEYQAQNSSKTEHFTSLLDYFRFGKVTYNKTNSFNDICENYAAGIVRLLKKNTSKRKLNFLIDTLSDRTDCYVFKEWLKYLIFLPIESETDWQVLRKNLVENVQKFYQLDISGYDGLDWSASILNEINGMESKSPNCVRVCADNGRYVDLNFSSIHATKGCTHLATLVVDTFWYESNLCSIIPMLTGKVAKSSYSSRVIQRLKCHYVALTRAQALVALAVPSHRITDDDIQLLRADGWLLKNI